MNDIKHRKQVANVRKGSDRQSDELGADQKENTIYIKHRKQIENGKVIEGRLGVGLYIKHRKQEENTRRPVEGKVTEGTDQEGHQQRSQNTCIEIRKLKLLLTQTLSLFLSSQYRGFSQHKYIKLPTRTRPAASPLPPIKNVLGANKYLLELHRCCSNRLLKIDLKQ